MKAQVCFSVKSEDTAAELVCSDDIIYPQMAVTEDPFFMWKTYFSVSKLWNTDTHGSMVTPDNPGRWYQQFLL